MLDHLDAHAGVVGRLPQPGDDEQPAGRIDVAREDVDLHGLVLAEERGVRHGDRGGVALRRGGDLDADGARRGLTAVGHGVLEEMGAHGGAREPEGALVEVRCQVGLGLGRNRREPGLSRTAADVAEGLEPDLLARRGERHERLRDERRLARRPDPNLERARALVAPVRHDETDAATVALAAALVEDHHAVGGGGRVVRVARRGGAEEHGVAVRVDPLAEHRGVHPAAGFDHCAHRTDLRRRTVLVRLPHGDPRERLGDAAATVVDVVAEVENARDRLVERELQLLPVRDEVDPRAGREVPRGAAHDEDIAIGVVIVQQHGQQRRPPRTRAELVVDGDGWDWLFSVATGESGSFCSTRRSSRSISISFAQLSMSS